MEQVLAQILNLMQQQQAATQASQTQLAQELLASRNDMIAMLLASEKKMEARGKQWDDADRYKTSIGFSGKPSEWDKWSTRLLRTTNSRSIKVHEIMRLVEHKISEKVLESDGYEQVLAMMDDDMPEPEELIQFSAKLHQLLGDVQQAVRMQLYAGAAMLMESPGCFQR